MSKDQLDRLQLKLLKIMARRMYESSTFYHQRMREAGVMPDVI